MTTARACRNRGERAQGVLETALVIPILLGMIAGFLALMIQVQVQQEMETATKLALVSTFQASRCDRSAPGVPSIAPPGSPPDNCQFIPDTPSPNTALSLNTALQKPYCFPRTPRTKPGTPPSCLLGTTITQPLAYAYDSFYGTLNFYDQFLKFDTSRPNGARVDCRGPWLGDQVLAEDGDATHPQLVVCKASATLEFSRTPLAWAVVWNPTIDARATGNPPPFRQ